MKSTAETVIDNIQSLLLLTGMSVRDLHKASGVSVRTINSYLSGERKPSVEITDQIARGFGLNGWHLLMPYLRYDMVKSGQLDKLINKYSQSSQSTQQFINDVLDREAS